MHIYEPIAPTDTRDVYTPDEVAKKLGMSRRGVYNFLKRGEIPGRYVGRRWIIAKDDFARYLHDHHLPPSEDDPDVESIC